MPSKLFLDPRLADDTGIVAFGGPFTRRNLTEAYREGIFPWPSDQQSIYWVCPARRAIIEFDELHIPRSLRKERARTTFTCTIDRDFRRVIASCARIHGAEEHGTWILDEMIDAYIDLHETGYAHSVEVWDGDELVGGLYGVEIDGVFSGESMFHLRANASKFALLHLIDTVRDRGGDWIDIQTMTPHMEVLGAKEISRTAFLKKLAATHARRIRLFDGVHGAAA